MVKCPYCDEALPHAAHAGLPPAPSGFRRVCPKKQEKLAAEWLEEINNDPYLKSMYLSRGYHV